MKKEPTDEYILQTLVVAERLAYPNVETTPEGEELLNNLIAHMLLDASDVVDQDGNKLSEQEKFEAADRICPLSESTQKQLAELAASRRRKRRKQ